MRIIVRVGGGLLCLIKVQQRWITVPERRRRIIAGGRLLYQRGGLKQVVDHCTGEEEDYSGWWITAPEKRRMMAGEGSLHRRGGGL